ncbi:MAG: hypothetical protein HC814_04785 [Rhodobacteraceae bacterium]|nr:hypothetical protein [Paracoccaceae bacterium]
MSREIDLVRKDIVAVAEFARAHGKSNGKLVVASFRGGAKGALAAASQVPNLQGVFLFSGFAPVETVTKINAPVYGYYGSADLRLRRNSRSSRVP